MVYLIVGFLYLTSILLAQEPWTKKADMPTARLAFGTAVVDGKIYVIGGQQNETVPLSVVEVYDPDTDSWDTTKTPMPRAKGGFGCAVVDGKIYVMGGGVVGIEKLADVWMYDPETDKWDTTLTDMNVARFTLAADTVNEKIYAIGGADTVGVQILWGISTVEEYDPLTDAWTFKKDKPTAGWGLRACTLGGKIYVTGGNIMWPDISAALEVYDPVTDSWDTTKTPMPEEKYSHSTCVVNGKIYAFGGWNNSGYGPMYDDVDEYDPEKDLWTENCIHL
jgi:N-acetylneuraminic acid mutarotase